MVKGPFERLNPRIPRFHPDAVTSCEGHPEADPRAAGLTQAQVATIWEAVQGMYGSRLYPAIGFCMRRHGHVVLDRALGHERGNRPGDGPEVERVPATPSSLFNLFSSSKMITAMVVHHLAQQGEIELNLPVAEYLPEFGRKGKDRITIRHVLTHRAGIPRIPEEHASLELLTQPDKVREILFDAELQGEPGSSLAYHAVTGGFVLGAVVEAATGKPIQDVLRERIREPLGLERLAYGVPEQDVGRVVPNVMTGPPVLPPASHAFRNALGVGFAEAVALSNDPRFLTGVIPAGNIVGTAEEACRFAELLLAGGTLGDAAIFEPATIRRAVSEQSYLQVDATLGFPFRYGMGFMLGGDFASLYGTRTRNAFGHLGFTNVVLCADPDRDISYALLTNGKPFVGLGVLKWLRVMQTIADTVPREGQLPRN